MNTASDETTQADVTAAAPGLGGTRDGERALRQGDTVGRYVVQSRIGRGAMGSVFAAFDPRLKRQVAIKLLHPRRSDAKHRQRVLREAQAMARLSHPNVVTVHHVGERGEDVFIVMALIDGQTLKAWLRGNPTTKEVLDVMIAAGRGLAAAHAAGLIHRDFKPDNILVDGRGRPFVTDLGLAREHASVQAAPTGGGDRADERDCGDEQLTGSGAFQGTPAYMSPEQFAGGDLDPRSDQFAYCVVLYEALCGQRPFVGDTAIELAVSVPEGDVREPPASAALPPALRKVIWRGLCVDPQRRWPSMDALLTELAKTGKTRWGYLWPLAIVAAGGTAWAIAGRTTDARATDSCEPALDRARAVWSNERRDAIRHRMLATELGIAAQTWDRLDDALSARMRVWQTAYNQACVALQPEDPDTRDDVVRCLRDRLRETEEFARVVDEVDAAMLPRTLTAAVSLEPLDECSDRSTPGVDGLSPQDAAAAEEVRRTLDRALALRKAGRSTEATPLVDDALAAAAAVPDERLEVEAMLAAGELRRELAKWKAALEVAETAYHRARADRHSDLAFRAAVLLARVHRALDDPETAKQWARHAEAELGAELWPPRREVVLLRTRAAVADAAGDPAEALAELEHALELQLALDPDSLSTAAIHTEIASAAKAGGDMDRARADFTAAAKIRERLLGKDHPDIANDIEGLAAIAYADGDEAGAAEGFERVLAIRELAYGTEHPKVASTLSNLAAMLSAMGRQQDALPLHERALTIHRQAQSPNPRRVGSASLNYAQTLAALGRQQEALDLIDRTLRVLEGRGDAARMRAQLRINRGSALRGLGRHDEALAEHQRGLDAFVALYGPNHWKAVGARRNLAQTLGQMERYDEAIAMLDEAYVAEMHAESPSHATLCDTLGEKAAILGHVGQASKRIEALEQALVHADESTQPVRQARARRNLAEALAGANHRSARAIALAQEGLTFVNSGQANVDEERESLEAFLRRHQRRRPPP